MLLLTSHVRVLSDVVIGSQHVELRDVEVQTGWRCVDSCLHCLFPVGIVKSSNPNLNVVGIRQFQANP